ncbi:hypothetical protein TNCT_30261 [Trichonephila clavata]|uniref:SCP domain-containing protein n=1 Tax=Trichonephila clavata TaxID=2740835 RepID=A0A8X6FUS6_TRICU|nr:hypothetical protein TNCT_30261 [Trichonephila clavata]
MQMTKHHSQVVVAVLFILSVTCDASCKYEKFSADHTYCKAPNKKCKILEKGVTDKEKGTIVKCHNTYRNKIANGKEKSLGGMPEAADMMEMVWDDELAAIAQKHAEQCEFDHDCNACRKVERFHVGQNLKLDLSNKKPKKTEWKRMVKKFYGEIEEFDKKCIEHFHFSTYGHFTQVVWATTWRIGCGKSMYMENNRYSVFLVCNYGPAGNVADKEVYEKGKPCSKCPKKTCCGESCKKHKIKANYEGLCKVLDVDSFQK